MRINCKSFNIRNTVIFANFCNTFIFANIRESDSRISSIFDTLTPKVQLDDRDFKIFT